MKHIILIIALFLMAACFRSQIIAPGSKNFQLARASDSCRILESRKVYQLFGLGAINFNNNTTAVSLENADNNAKVRFTTQICFSDYLIAILSLGIIGSQTITTEICQ